MIHETLTISAKDHEASAYTYLLDNTPEVDAGRKRPLIIICPGGGYEFTSDREAEPVAIQFNAAGFHAIVLRYSVSSDIPSVFPVALLQLAQVVSIARSRAAEWNIDPHKVIICGFSAGGHLAASLGVFWNKGLISKELGGYPEIYHPDALMLNYAVITSGKYAHQGSIDNIYGKDGALASAYSLEKLVDQDTPPTFLWHTYEDDAVPVENSLLFAGALRRFGVPFELHVYQHGGHGLSLGTAETGNPGTYANVPTWISLACEWARHL